MLRGRHQLGEFAKVSTFARTRKGIGRWHDPVLGGDRRRRGQGPAAPVAAASEAPPQTRTRTAIATKLRHGTELVAARSRPQPRRGQSPRCPSCRLLARGLQSPQARDQPAMCDLLKGTAGLPLHGRPFTRGARWLRCAMCADLPKGVLEMRAYRRRGDESCVAISPFGMPSRTRPSTWSSRAGGRARDGVPRPHRPAASNRRKWDG